MHNIYLDASATTPPHVDVINKLKEIQSECWGNPSSIHKVGVIARAVSYTHLRAPRDRTRSRMPSSA